MTEQKKSVKKPSKAELEKLKNEILKEYVRLKKESSDPTYKVTRGSFLNKTKYKKHQVDKCFGSYSELTHHGYNTYYKSLPKSSRALLSEETKKFDLTATSEDCINDLRKLAENNSLGKITRDFYRINGKYSDSTWNGIFGTFQEFRRQAGLELTRHQHKLERDIAKHAHLDKIRDFYENEVLPYHNKFDRCNDTNRFKTLLIGSDFHDIDCDEFCLSVFIDIARRTQPDVIILNGDIFDCYESSRFSQDPRQLKIVERFNFVKERIFGPLREICPDSQIDLILGNHEWRILNTLSEKTPNLRVILSDVMNLSLSDVFGLDEFQINLVCKLDIAAFTKSDMKNQLKQNYRVYYDCFVAGHFKDIGYGMSGTSGHCHRPKTETFTNLIMGKCSWVETGAMCHTNAEYVPHRDKWTNSFLLAHIDTLAKTVVPEHIIIPYNFVVVHGVRYERKESTTQYSAVDRREIQLPKGVKKGG